MHIIIAYINIENIYNYRIKKINIKNESIYIYWAEICNKWDQGLFDIK